MSGVCNWCRDIWDRYNPFDIPLLFSSLSDKLEAVNTSMAAIEKKLIDDIAIMEKEIEYHKNIVQVIGETIPDMLWLKDVEGKYMYANHAIRCGLLFSSTPIGKTDKELSLAAKARFGSKNHTFGEVCGNSDKVVLDNLKSQRFLEHGRIKGKMVYLEVHKAPFYMDGELAGVAGVGRDMTGYVEAANKPDCGNCVRNDVFKKFEFEG